MIRLIKPTG